MVVEHDIQDFNDDGMDEMISRLTVDELTRTPDDHPGIRQDGDSCTFAEALEILQCETFADDDMDILIIGATDVELNGLSTFQDVGNKISTFDCGFFPDDTTDALLFDMGKDDTLNVADLELEPGATECSPEDKGNDILFDATYDDILAATDDDVLFGPGRKVIAPELALELCKTQGQIWAGCEYVLDSIGHNDMWLDLSSVGRLLASNLGLVNDLLALLRNAKAVAVCRGGLSPSLPKALTDNYALRNVAPDGNCFYNALSTIIFGHDKFQAMFRIAALVTLIFNTQKFSNYLSVTASTDDIAYYCRKIVGKSKKLSEEDLGQADLIWADDTTIAATAFALRKPIIVVQPFNTMPTLLAITEMKHLCRMSGPLISNYQGTENVNSESLVVYLANMHFQALLLKDGGEVIKVKPNSFKM